MTKLILPGVVCLALAFSVIASQRSELERLASEQARRLPKWSYEKLAAESDLVAIVEPLQNQPAKDEYSGNAHGHPAHHFVATNSRFRVHAVFKTAGDAVKELSVLHFGYAANVRRSRSASFINFVVGSMSYEKRIVLPPKTPMSDVELGPAIMFIGKKPMWLAFLKRRADGRFEPVSGQYDSALSFRELHEPSFYAAP